MTDPVRAAYADAAAHLRKIADSFPVGHEQPTRGASSYNWFKHCADAILARAAEVAASPAPDLSDPNAVHLNMLRGTLAKPTVEQIIHIYGIDALCKALAPQIVREAGNEPS
jgi:hypothetical protein